MTLSIYHPIFAVAGIALLALLAAIAARATPFFRRELRIEGVTRLTPLDGLRGILCFAVMYHHGALIYFSRISGDWDEPPSAFYNLLGQSAVGFFFCVTAFLFWSRAIAAKGNLDPWPFLRARWFRVAPLYTFSTLLAIGIVARHLDWKSLSTFKEVAKIALFGIRALRTTGNVNIGAVNANVSWSLQYEWAFYIALPALALLTRGRSAMPVALLGAGLLVMTGSSPCLFFLPGIAAAHIARRPQWVQSLRGPGIGAMIVVLLSALPIVTHNGFGMIALVVTTLTFIPMACGNSLFGILNFSGLRLMGLISYSVYLLHGIVLYLSKAMLFRDGHNPAGTRPAMYWACVFALSCLTLILCMITYQWIEYPCIHFEKRLRSKSARLDQPRSASQALSENQS